MCTITCDPSIISDVFWLQSLVAQLRDCLENGELLPFSEAVPENVHSDETRMFYVDDPIDGNHMDIALDVLVDELHHDVVSSFSDELSNVDVRIYLGECDGERYVDLAVFEKGLAEMKRRPLFTVDPTNPFYGICA